MATTNFNTSYLLGELGYGIFTARYLYVASKVFGPQHLHRARLLAGSDGRGDQRGDELLWRRGRPRAARAGFDDGLPPQRHDQAHRAPGLAVCRNFSYEHRGLPAGHRAHARWGFVFGAEIAGAKARERELFVATDGNGTSRRLDRTAIILSVAKRF